MFRFFMILILSPVLPVPGPALEDEQDLFLLRLQRTDRQDARALLDLGSWCEERSKLSWAARCYRMAVMSGSGRDAQESAFRLAKIELEKKDYHGAYRRLRELVERHGHAGARSILEKAASPVTRQQWTLVKEGDQFFEREIFVKARERYVSAYRLAPKGESSADFVPGAELLERIARCVDRIDDEFYRTRVAPLERSIRPCARECGEAGGFEQCSRCDGQGKVRKAVRVGRRIAYQYVTCGRCNGYCWHLCTQCLGVQNYPASGALTGDEKEVIRDVINKVRNPRVLKMSLTRALREIERVILGVEHSTALNFLRSIRPNYSFSRRLRDAIASVPPSAATLKGAEVSWKAVRDIRARSNFLSSYACEFAHHVRHYDMLRGLRRNPRYSSRPSASTTDGEPVRPAVLSAFPDDGTRGWIVVRGVLRGTSQDDKDPGKERLKIAGEADHNVNFFVWLPAARPHLESLEKGPWKSRLSGLTRAYPFDIRETVRQAPVGNRVTLVGRFLRDRLGYPRNWFEIWDLHVGLSPSQEAIVESLEESVDLAFRRIELEKLAGVLRWFGIAMVFSGVEPDTAVSCEATACPVGLLIDSVATALDADWHLADGQVHLGAAATGESARDTAVALRHLAGQGSVRVGRAGEGAGVARPAGTRALPRAPGELETRARESTLAMDYLDADRCLTRLQEQARDGKRRSELGRQLGKVRFFHAITRNTPVSHLVEARNLALVVFRNRAGEKFEQTVNVLERDRDSLRFQPGYGGEVRMPASRIISQEDLTPVQWRRRKESELAAREREASRATSVDRVNKFFLLGLFAKTYRFTDRGTAFLERALAEERSDWLVETYFPDDRDRLMVHWRRATGRVGATSRPEPPEVASRPPSTRRATAVPEFVEAPLPSAAGALFSFARKYYLEGRRHLSRSLPGMENSQAWKRLALGHFELARKALDRLLRLQPADGNARRLRPQVTLMIQTCIKDLGFFD